MPNVIQTTTTTLPETGLIRVTHAMAALHLKKSAFYDQVSKGKLPRIIKVGSRSLMCAEEIRAAIKLQARHIPAPGSTVHICK